VLSDGSHQCFGSELHISGLLTVKDRRPEVLVLSRWWSVLWYHHLMTGSRTKVLKLPQYSCKVKGKGFPYSLPSIGPGADHGVQALSPQVTISHPPGGRLPLLSARPAVTFPAAEHHSPLAGTKLYCVTDDRWRRQTTTTTTDASDRYESGPLHYV